MSNDGHILYIVQPCWSKFLIYYKTSMINKHYEQVQLICILVYTYFISITYKIIHVTNIIY